MSPEPTRSNPPENRPFERRSAGAAAPAPPAPGVRRAWLERLPVVDAARGLAIVLMLLDHAGFFSHVNVLAESYAGRPGRLGSPGGILVGLLTNVSAPTFWFLGGASIALMARRERRVNSTDDFLLIRAGALFLIDLLLVSWEWNPLKPPHPTVGFELLSCLGFALLLMIPIRRLPDRAVVALTIALLASFAWLTRAVPQPALEQLTFPARVLVTFDSVHPPVVTFPVFGWLGLMTFGLWAGRRLADGRWQRAGSLVRAAALCFALWLVARGTGLGSAHAWRPEQGFTALWIMRKGPPALDFLAFNLGLGLMAMAAFMALGDSLRRGPGRWLIGLGQAPLFLFVVHLLVAFACARIFLHLFRDPAPLRFALTFACTVVLLVPMARWYRALKDRHPEHVIHFL